MKKIPTIFKRDPENMRVVLPEWNPDCIWVSKGEGIALRKYDGTCCLVREGKLWKRREVKKDREYPVDFVREDYDEITGKTTGWVPVENNKENRWHIEGFAAGNFPNGTYELCGPKIQGNPEKCEYHTLINHLDALEYHLENISFPAIRDFLTPLDIEGLVFRHPNGQMGKIKKRDFGQKRYLVHPDEP